MAYEHGEELQEQLCALRASVCTWTSVSRCLTPEKEKEDLPGRGGDAGPLCRDESPGRALASPGSSSQEEELVVGRGALLLPAPRACGTWQGVAEYLYKYLKKPYTAMLKMDELCSSALAAA